jgi:hypothetical protein
MSELDGWNGHSALTKFDDIITKMYKLKYQFISAQDVCPSQIQGAC